MMLPPPTDQLVPESGPSPDTIAELKALNKELKILNAHRFVRVHNSVARLIGFNFLRGLAFGLGTVLGASVLLSLVVWSLSQIEFLPIIGEWAAEIARQMQVSK